MISSSALCYLCCTEIGLDNLASHVENECPRRLTPCSLCNATIVCENQKFHMEQECYFRLISCTLCNCTVKLNSMKDHLSGTCPSRPQVCAKCSNVVSFSHYQTHLSEECPRRKIPCSLCHEQIEVSKMAEHDNYECDLRLVECPVFNSGLCGCKGMIEVSMLDYHVAKFHKHSKPSITLQHTSLSRKRGREHATADDEISSKRLNSTDGPNEQLLAEILLSLSKDDEDMSVDGCGDRGVQGPAHWESSSTSDSSSDSDRSEDEEAATDVHQNKSALQIVDKQTMIDIYRQMKPVIQQRWSLPQVTKFRELLLQEIRRPTGQGGGKNITMISKKLGMSYNDCNAMIVRLTVKTADNTTEPAQTAATAEVEVADKPHAGRGRPRKIAAVVSLESSNSSPSDAIPFTKSNRQPVAVPGWNDKKESTLRKLVTKEQRDPTGRRASVNWQLIADGMKMDVQECRNRSERFLQHGNSRKRQRSEGATEELTQHVLMKDLTSVPEMEVANTDGTEQAAMLSGQWTMNKLIALHQFALAEEERSDQRSSLPMDWLQISQILDMSYNECAQKGQRMLRQRDFAHWWRYLPRRAQPGVGGGVHSGVGWDDSKSLQLRQYLLNTDDDDDEPHWKAIADSLSVPVESAILHGIKMQLMQEAFSKKHRKQQAVEEHILRMKEVLECDWTAEKVSELKLLIGSLSHAQVFNCRQSWLDISQQLNMDMQLCVDTWHALSSVTQSVGSGGRMKETTTLRASVSYPSNADFQSTEKRGRGRAAAINGWTDAKMTQLHQLVVSAHKSGGVNWKSVAVSMDMKYMDCYSRGRKMLAELPQQQQSSPPTSQEVVVMPRRTTARRPMVIDSGSESDSEKSDVQPQPAKHRNRKPSWVMQSVSSSDSSSRDFSDSDDNDQQPQPSRHRRSSRVVDSTPTSESESCDDSLNSVSDNGDQSDCGGQSDNGCHVHRASSWTNEKMSQLRELVQEQHVNYVLTPSEGMFNWSTIADKLAMPYNDCCVRGAKIRAELNQSDQTKSRPEPRQVDKIAQMWNHAFTVNDRWSAEKLEQLRKLSMQENVRPTGARGQINWTKISTDMGMPYSDCSNRGRRILDVVNQAAKWHCSLPPTVVGSTVAAAPACEQEEQEQSDANISIASANLSSTVIDSSTDSEDGVGEAVTTDKMATRHCTGKYKVTANEYKGWTDEKIAELRQLVLKEHRSVARHGGKISWENISKTLGMARIECYEKGKKMLDEMTPAAVLTVHNPTTSSASGWTSKKLLTLQKLVSKERLRPTGRNGKMGWKVIAAKLNMPYAECVYKGKRIKDQLDSAAAAAGQPKKRKYTKRSAGQQSSSHVLVSRVSRVSRSVEVTPSAVIDLTLDDDSASDGETGRKGKADVETNRGRGTAVKKGWTDEKMTHLRDLVHKEHRSPSHAGGGISWRSISDAMQMNYDDCCKRGRKMLNEMLTLPTTANSSPQPKVPQPKPVRPSLAALPQSSVVWTPEKVSAMRDLVAKERLHPTGNGGAMCWLSMAQTLNMPYSACASRGKAIKDRLDKEAAVATAASREKHDMAIQTDDSLPLTAADLAPIAAASQEEHKHSHGQSSDAFFEPSLPVHSDQLQHVEVDASLQTQTETAENHQLHRVSSVSSGSVGGDDEMDMLFANHQDGVYCLTATGVSRNEYQQGQYEEKSLPCAKEKELATDPASRTWSISEIQMLHAVKKGCSKADVAQQLNRSIGECSSKHSSLTYFEQRYEPFDTSSDGKSFAERYLQWFNNDYGSLKQQLKLSELSDEQLQALQEGVAHEASIPTAGGGKQVNWLKISSSTGLNKFDCKRLGGQLLRSMALHPVIPPPAVEPQHGAGDAQSADRVEPEVAVAISDGTEDNSHAEDVDKDSIAVSACNPDTSAPNETEECMCMAAEDVESSATGAQLELPISTDSQALDPPANSSGEVSRPSPAKKRATPVHFTPAEDALILQRRSEWVQQGCPVGGMWGALDVELGRGSGAAYQRWKVYLQAQDASAATAATAAAQACDKPELADPPTFDAVNEDGLDVVDTAAVYGSHQESAVLSPGPTKRTHRLVKWTRYELTELYQHCVKQRNSAATNKKRQINFTQIGKLIDKDSKQCSDQWNCLCCFAEQSESLSIESGEELVAAYVEFRKNELAGNGQGGQWSTEQLETLRAFVEAECLAPTGPAQGINWPAISVRLNRPSKACYAKGMPFLTFSAEMDDAIVKRHSEWVQRGQSGAFWAELEMELKRSRVALQKRLAVLVTAQQNAWSAGSGAPDEASPPLAEVSDTMQQDQEETSLVQRQLQQEGGDVNAETATSAAVSVAGSADTDSVASTHFNQLPSFVDCNEPLLSQYQSPDDLMDMLFASDPQQSHPQQESVENDKKAENAYYEIHDLYDIC